MSELRGIAGCPQCKVPWVVEDWATYLSVVCPKCGRKVGEVATDMGLGLEVIGQHLPGGVPPQKSVVVPTRPLTAHKGTHIWQEHDGYPRHQHSINGVLTIPLSGERVHPKPEAFHCGAKIWTGPGHQSSHRCTRKDPHALDGDHWVTEVAHEWTGSQAFADGY